MTTKTRRFGLALATTALALLGLAAGAGSALAAPQWGIAASSNTTVQPGGQIVYYVSVRNVGDEATDGSQIEIEVDLPAGLVVKSAQLAAGFAVDCSSLIPDTDDPFACTSGELVGPAGETSIEVLAEAAPLASGALTTTFEVSGGNAAPASTLDSTRVAASPPGFGVDSFDTQLTDDLAGAPFTRAGGHPYAFETRILLNTVTHPKFGPVWPAGSARDIVVDLPPGLLGDPTVAGQCTAEQLAHPTGRPDCPVSSQVGVVLVRFNGLPKVAPYGIFNMAPPAGTPARFAFSAAGTLINLDATLRSDGDYGLSVGSLKSPQPLAIVGSEVTIWGNPSDPVHDPLRACPGFGNGELGKGCIAEAAGAFLRLPTYCPPAGQGLPWSMRTDSWESPGAYETASFESHLPPGFPAAPEDWGAPQGPSECEGVPVRAELDAQPTSIEAETPTGLEVKVEVPNPGIANPDGISSSDIKAVEVALPQGVTINPSQAEGLGVCSPERYESTELSFLPTPGKGCPDDSKIGTVSVKTPLLDETIPGEVFVAKQDDPSTTTPGAENPFDSLLAIYVVLEEPERGVLVKLAGKVETDEATGRILTTFEDLPQQPFDSFEFRFREGARAPLVTPPTCGTYTTEAEFTPWSDPSRRLERTSSFEIARGVGGGPCPSAGTPAFKPGFSAGTLNNDAGSFSPTSMRLTRLDGEQSLTRFSATLPPGLLAKLAGVEQCSEEAIAAAKAKTGRSELASPSCPANARIGRTLAGAGVGSVLTYVPGSLYLAGPYKGAPLSIAAITPAVAGPFDVGTVVVREALDLDPVTGVASVDGAASDPIPHILKGIPLKLRDLRVYVDRPEFTLNATSCDPSALGATLWGSAADVFNPADDVAVSLSARYQAANCSSLGFKPRLTLNLKGGTKRGGHPALRAILTPRPGDANLSRTVVRLPRSAFLDQAHIRTVCTRVQWAADACPKGAIYGRVTAFTPLLSEPLRGNAYLRSSDNKLPDLVFDLKGLVDIEAAARIDSIRGGIRATFPFVPDAPLSKAIVEMRGAKKGLIVNSRNLCKGKNRADAKLDGHNGKAWDFRPLMRAQCGKAGKGKR